MSIHSNEVPKVIRDFLVYIETIKGKSPKTSDEYFLDLRVFFRFIKCQRGLVSDNIPFDAIPIHDVDIDLIETIKLSDVYDYMHYLSRDRVIIRNRTEVGCGLGAAARARKTSSLKVFFNYLTNKVKLIHENPVQELEAPKLKSSLPKYLTIEESRQLLLTIAGDNAQRDYCILIFFLSCGLRVSELVNTNIGDITDDGLRITGKGNKERMVYLNDACLSALKDYLIIRDKLTIPKSEKALFISRNHRRISVSTVKWLVKKYLSEAGLDNSKYSVHKLRHTAATLMYQNGVDVRTLQSILGHESLNTTKIYTHISDEQVKKAINSNPISDFKKSTSPSTEKSINCVKEDDID